MLLPVGIKQPLNKPYLDHVDLITGDVTGPIAPGAAGYAVANAAGVAGAAIVYNASAKIAKQIQATKMKSYKLKDGSVRLSFTTSFVASEKPFYIRARGTNIPPATPNVSDSAGNPLLDLNNVNVSCTDAACPSHLGTVNGVKRVTNDVQAWSNVWFYANPIFVRPHGTPKLLVEKNHELARKLAHEHHHRHDWDQWGQWGQWDYWAFNRDFDRD